MTDELPVYERCKECRHWPIFHGLDGCETPGCDCQLANYGVYIS